MLYYTVILSFFSWRLTIWDAYPWWDDEITAQVLAKMLGLKLRQFLKTGSVSWRFRHFYGFLLFFIHSFFIFGEEVWILGQKFVGFVETQGVFVSVFNKLFESHQIFGIGENLVLISPTERIRHLTHLEVLVDERCMRDTAKPSLRSGWWSVMLLAHIQWL